MLLPGHRLLFSDDADAPEWVTYQYSIPPTGTLPHSFGNRAGATADSRVGISNGSRLYELNHWMWRYGRGQPHKITVEEAEQRRRERLTEARKRAVQTLKRRREERGTVQAAVDKDAVGDE